MRTRELLKSRKCMAYRRGTGGLTGVRMSGLAYFWSQPISPIKRCFPRHLLILLRNGAVAFRRDGETALADAGDVLFIPAGEGELELLPSRVPDGLHGLIVEFDLRSIARQLRDSAVAEHAALQPRAAPDAALVFPRLQLVCFPNGRGVESPSFDVRQTFGILFGQLASYTAAFTRAAFYEDRWRLLQFLENQIWHPLTDRSWMETYETGALRLAKDCAFYVGCSPETFCKRRKMETASAWLRCRKKVEEIARVLGFSSTWEFQSLYGAVTKRRCADVQDETPLSALSLSPEDLYEALVPFWWSKQRPATGELPTEFLREMSKGFQRAAERAQFSHSTYVALGPAPRGKATPPAPGAPAKAAGPWLRARAEEFFAMKTTATDIIVPFFRDHPVRRPLAA